MTDKKGCINAVSGILARLVGSGRSEASESPAYRLRADWLTDAELSFYRVLREALGPTVTICPKVTLGQLLWANCGDRRVALSLMNRIDRKCTDLLVCDANTLRPLVAVELDDRSHARPRRRERDALVENALRSAGLPLVRIPVQPSYSMADLRATFNGYLQVSHTERPLAETTVGADESPGEHGPTEEAPVCPQCGQPMALRTVRRGAREGQRFWGCSSYPRCRGMRPASDADAGPPRASVAASS